MARAASTDFLHSMRFHVNIDGSGDSLIIGDLNSGGADAAAGFMSCSTPELTVEAVEYREGTYNYPRKYPGNATVSDVSLQRGVTRTDTAFWQWVRSTAEGSGNYRTTMTIKHFDRRVLTQSRGDLSKGSPDNAANKTDTLPAKKYILNEAFPIRHKVAGDLDASSSDISVQELDVAYETFDVVIEATSFSPTGVA